MVGKVREIREGVFETNVGFMVAIMCKGEGKASLIREANCSNSTLKEKVNVSQLPVEEVSGLAKVVSGFGSPFKNPLVGSLLNQLNLLGWYSNNPPR